MHFEDIIGNQNIKLQLQIASQAARINNTSVPHVLFAGAAGCGKTSMSKALANSLNTNLIKIPPESIKTSQDMIDISERMNYSGYNKEGEVIGQRIPTVIFLDEIHKMSLSGQESLGIAMEEWYTAVKNKWTGEVDNIWLPRFTVVGATTLEGKLSKPLLDRFKLTFYFETYDLEHSIAIVNKHAELNKISITEEGALEIAKRSRGVPRIMVGYLNNCADGATVAGHKVVDETAAVAIFNIMGIDKTGLTDGDIKILKSLHESGAPVGLDTLAVITNISPQTIQDAREPFLIQRGLILRTGRGRMLTKKGRDYLAEGGHIKSNRRFQNVS